MNMIKIALVGNIMLCIKIAGDNVLNILPYLTIARSSLKSLLYMLQSEASGNKQLSEHLPV